MISTSISPEVFDKKNISKDIHQMNEHISSLLTNAPPSHEIPFEVLQEIRRKGGGLFPYQSFSDQAENRTVEYNSRKVPVRVFNFANPKFIYLHIHGGGHCIGAADMQDQSLEKISRNLSCVVISIEYRLAPDNPYPAAPDDCETVALWLVENSKKEFNTEKIIIGGESAGANLSAVTLQRLKNKNMLEPFKGANLIYGSYDARLTPSTLRKKDSDEVFLLSYEMIRKFRDSYFQGNIDLSSPDVSPIQGDLSGMPPALFTVGTRDLLLDDSLFMYGRWLSYGSHASILIIAGADHAFNAFQSETTSSVENKISEFIKSVI
ncbi:MAG: alpha/beta hydrolase [Pelagibacteraceae bacterium]|jgi:acetyl esterase/lipase|nr:alpha/beta hydrolase [Pelagibacteraceae bacterium]